MSRRRDRPLSPQMSVLRRQQSVVTIDMMDGSWHKVVTSPIDTKHKESVHIPATLGGVLCDCTGDFDVPFFATFGEFPMLEDGGEECRL